MTSPQSETDEEVNQLESSSPKSGTANLPLQTALPPARGNLSMASQHHAEGAVISTESDKQRPQPSNVEEKRQNFSLQHQSISSLSSNSKKLNEGTTEDGSRRKRKRVEPSLLATHALPESVVVEFQTSDDMSKNAKSSLPPIDGVPSDVSSQREGNRITGTVSQRHAVSAVPAGPSLSLVVDTAPPQAEAGASSAVAPLFAVPPRGSLPTAVGANLQNHLQPHLHHQFQASAMNSWSQLPSSVQSALLTSAAASVGPVFPGQPPHLASLLAIQQASQIAAAGQLYAANPLAGQIFLQQLMGAAAGAGAPAMALPMGANLAAMFPVRPGLHHPAWVLPPFMIQGATQPFPGGGLSIGSDGGQLSLRGSQLSSVNGQTVNAPNPASMPLTAVPVATAGVVGEGNEESSRRPSQFQQTYTADQIGPEVPESLPAVLDLPEDEMKLSAYQLLLRSQIEAFSASADDLATHARGRNKPITLRQVGIRCRHCKHIALNRRKKGSVYFPFSLLGLYQAAQNMGASHFHGESCSALPPDLKEKFVESIACKSTVGSGKQYWAKSARKLGLVDTEHGIRFIRDLVLS